MTKCDSAYAGIVSLRGPMSLYRRQSPASVTPSRASASSDRHSSNDPGQSSWFSNPHQSGPTASGDASSSVPHFGYTSDVPQIPLPSDSQWNPQGVAFPVQSESQKRNQVSHSHLQEDHLACWIKHTRPPGGDGSR